MKILIIGANGFLGRHIAQAALAKSWNVWCMYRTNREYIPGRCKTISISALANVRDTFDAVFLSVGNHTMELIDLFESNLKTTINASEHFPSAKLVYISSVAVYGTPPSVIDEQTGFYNPSLYGQAKIAGELATKGHARYAILRLTHLYGPGMDATSLIPTLIHDTHAKHAITLHGDAKRKRDSLHVGDAAELALRAAQVEDNGIYLGATGKSVSVLTIARIIQKHIPHTKILTRPGSVLPSCRFNPKYTMTTLRWKPQIGLEMYLKELIASYAG